ncbi:Type IV secretory pathway VirB4 protein-like protein [Alicyclobacillus hesperidum URH17-3-68]|nr:Type IV secretory pathway VirB4 protein-like protein [Alicyclobacillus hesperidum URH17-3-68]
MFEKCDKRVPALGFLQNEYPLSTRAQVSVEAETEYHLIIY